MESSNIDNNSIISNTILNNKSFFNNLLLELFNPIILKIKPYLVFHFLLQFINLILIIIVLYKMFFI